MNAETLPITADIDGRRVSRAEVLAWEARRAAKVFKKLGIARPPGDLVSQRQALVAKKRELGHRGIERLLVRELRWSARAGQVAGALSRGRRRLCSIELSCTTGSGEIVAQWYHDAMTAKDEAPLIAGCPDHYLLHTRADGAQEVVETTGGSPLAMRIFLDESDTLTLTTSADPAFPVQWVGVGRNGNGVPVGGIRHQFRDERSGFQARLTVEFPATTPPHMIRAHRWHLACEFSNWIDTANSRSA